MCGLNTHTYTHTLSSPSHLFKVSQESSLSGGLERHGGGRSEQTSRHPHQIQLRRADASCKAFLLSLWLVVGGKGFLCL